MSGPLGELPCEFGERSRPRARGARLRARGRAVDHAARDALQDRGEAEQVVGEVEVPVGQQRVGIGTAGSLAFPLRASRPVVPGASSGRT